MGRFLPKQFRKALNSLSCFTSLRERQRWIADAIPVWIFWEFFIPFGLPDPPLLKDFGGAPSCRRPPGWNRSRLRGLCPVRQELAWFKTVLSSAACSIVSADFGCWWKG